MFVQFSTYYFRAGWFALLRDGTHIWCLDKHDLISYCTGSYGYFHMNRNASLDRGKSHREEGSKRAIYIAESQVACI